MKGWYNRKTPEEKREWVQRRDKERQRLRDRLRYDASEERRKACSKWTRSHPEYNTEKERRWIEKYPEKKRAHGIVRNAILSGKLVRKPCETCGEAKTEAHHPDYSKPLDVRWLCKKHHMEQHKKPRVLTPF